MKKDSQFFVEGFKNMKKIGTKTPEILVMENGSYFMLVFDLSWTQLFGKVPTFDFFLDNNKRLVIITKEGYLKK